MAWLLFSGSLDSRTVAESKWPRGRRRGWLIFWVLSGLAAVTLAGGVATIFKAGRAFTEPSTSMENTVRPGDRVLVARTTQVRRGDVLVEQQTSPAPGDYIRRVIGLPGDHVACCDARGRITVNGKPLNELYLFPGDAPSEVRFKVTVPSGTLWLMGDHRRISYDSRELGPIAARVIGRVILVAQGGHVSPLRTPQTFVADGLAPAGEATPPALVGVYVSSVALVLLVMLAIVGVVCYMIGRRRRRKRGDPPAAAMYSPAAPPPPPGQAIGEQ
ncbi:MAG: signal peptidase I [Streptosporangiaceae bacterium]